MRISLHEITRETLPSVLKLKVGIKQERFVASNAKSIAEAHFAPEAWFRAVYAGEKPIGFVMLSEKPKEAEYVIWRMMIDERYQGKGFGRKILQLVVDHVRTKKNAEFLWTSIVPGNGSPGPFYEKMGFKLTGEEDDGELIMKLELLKPSGLR